MIQFPAQAEKNQLQASSRTWLSNAPFPSLASPNLPALLMFAQLLWQTRGRALCSQLPFRWSCFSSDDVKAANRVSKLSKNELIRAAVQ